MPIARTRRALVAQLLAWCAVLLLLLLPTGAQPPGPEPVPTGKPPAYPAWWFGRGVIPRLQAAQPAAYPANYKTPDDFAALNLGQLKAMATAAFDELEELLPGGAGMEIATLVKGWFVLNPDGSFALDPGGKRLPKTAGTDSFAAVNLGQLKAVARPFYTRVALEEPWAESLTPADDFAVANLGQLKALFAFDHSLDSDADGLPDWWEMAFFHSLTFTASQDADGDGVSNIGEYIAQTHPADFYNGGGPQMQIVNGTYRRGEVATWSTVPFVAVLRTLTGEVLKNAPVKFRVVTGDSKVAASAGGAGSAEFIGNTDNTGTLTVPLKFPTTFSGSLLLAEAGTSIIELTAVGAPPDDGPAAPTDLLLSLDDDHEISLEWKDASSNESGFKVNRSSDGITWEVIATLPPNSTGYTDSTYDAGYMYTVSSF